MTSLVRLLSPHSDCSEAGPSRAPTRFADIDPEGPSLEDVVRRVRGARRIVAVAGAGVSTAAAIPDFRSSKGLFSGSKGTGVKDLFHVKSLTVRDDGITWEEQRADVLVPGVVGETPCALDRFVRAREPCQPHCVSRPSRQPGRGWASAPVLHAEHRRIGAARGAPDRAAAAIVESREAKGQSHSSLGSSLIRIWNADARGDTGFGRSDAIVTPVVPACTQVHPVARTPQQASMFPVLHLCPHRRPSPASTIDYPVPDVRSVGIDPVGFIRATAPSRSLACGRRFVWRGTSRRRADRICRRARSAGHGSKGGEGRQG